MSTFSAELLQRCENAFSYHSYVRVSGWFFLLTSRGQGQIYKHTKLGMWAHRACYFATALYYCVALLILLLFDCIIYYCILLLHDQIHQRHKAGHVGTSCLPLYYCFLLLRFTAAWLFGCAALLYCCFTYCWVTYCCFCWFTYCCFTYCCTAALLTAGVLTAAVLALLNAALLAAVFSCSALRY